ncbi:APC family permease [Loigolactobacillus backii]|uniref:Amino acid permease n=1 Tax=Loigolactobacillus backii TaxID=375175 RepID=A0A192H042_9LACO|nr:amino acid permease [Loigolactobacillus backii]ANK58995.1 amino acid permease [Loigolactobacillus backii]ANK61336.1 amino acid permease [Loigolactobacillus backii]ANK63983.1 amino acid permease [Loigolactobacillus backii]ANK66432.1 amino acid permease [Loigolactobacillus backii]ANK69464.1 amino acid permease [Loigolactobacillus backii]
MKDDGLELAGNRNFIKWPVVALMDFVTVIGFDDIIYNFQNQGLGVVTSWIVMLFIYVLPYSLMVGHLGSVFSQEGGGLTSWVRGTSGDKVGYFAAWFYWVVGLPYIVDVANSVVVAFGWLISGNGNLEAYMSKAMFGILTTAIFIGFIFFEHLFKNKSLEIMSVIGGGAMFLMTVLFVVMTITSLVKGFHIATQPFTLKAFLPKIDGHFLTTLGLLIFAMNGSELAAPYVTDMKNPRKDFPKAMIMIAIMTAFLTVFGSFSLGVFFNAHHLPNDLKMNGSYYAFLALGRQFGWGKILMYVFAVTQAIYMCAQLAILLDAGTRVFLGDISKKYMPKQLSKLNADGLPINGYWMTTAICAIIMFLGGLLPQINDIFNWLLNLNGIVSPFATCFLFWAFMMVRRHSDRYPTPAYTYIKNDHLAFIVGAWMFFITFFAAVAAFFPTDAKPGTALYADTLIMNVLVTLGLCAIGLVMPIIARRQRNNNGAAYTIGQWLIISLIIIIGIILSYTISRVTGIALLLRLLYILIVDALLISCLTFVGRKTRA